MAAGMDERYLDDVNLDEDARLARARELERYHNLHVYRLPAEKELREVVLPPTPTSQRRGVVNGSHQQQHHPAEEIREGAAVGGHPATLAVTESHVQHQQQHPSKPKKQKRVPNVFSRFGAGGGRKGGGGGGGDHVAGGGREGREGEHNIEIGHDEKNGTFTHHGQGLPPEGYDKPVTLKVYPYYFKCIPGILRIIQLIVGVIVCAAVNAERCVSSSVFGIVCGSASSPLWYGVLGGQGFVLFVGIVFILGNIFIILYHICTKPKVVLHSPQQKQSLFSDKFVLAELAYSAAAVFMYIIAASVESWYASWTTLPTDWKMMSGVDERQVRNVYRPQWIAAAVFAWINVLLYAAHIVYSFLFR